MNRSLQQNPSEWQALLIGNGDFEHFKLNLEIWQRIHYHKKICYYF